MFPLVGSELFLKATAPALRIMANTTSLWIARKPKVASLRSFGLTGPTGERLS